MLLDMGVNAGFQPGGYTQSASRGTSANASPQGPSTAAQQAFGTTAGGAGGADAHTVGVLSAGSLALAALVWIWWTLPK